MLTLRLLARLSVPCVCVCLCLCVCAAVRLQRYSCPLQCSSVRKKDCQFVPPLWRGFINGVHSEAHWAGILNEVRDKRQLLVADFTGPWCGPSRQCCPKLTQIASKFNNVVFCKLQIDDGFGSFPNVRRSIGGLGSVPQF